MSNSITHDMRYRHSLMKYAEKYGASRASRKYNKGRSYIYFWRSRWDGTVESLACQSKRPHSLPRQHTEEELKLICDMRRRNPKLGLTELWYQLKKRGYSRTVESLFRCMRREGLIKPTTAKKKRQSKPYEKMTHGAVYKTLSGLSSVTGIPVAPAMREVVALVNNTYGYITGNRIQTYRTSKTAGYQALFGAIERGDDERAAEIRTELGSNNKYDVIFVSYEFFKKHENIAPFVDYFTNKVAYWGLDHPASAQDIWMQLNNCGVALDAVMFLMDKVGFGDLDLSHYQRIDIAGTADLGVAKKHTLFAHDEKMKWLLTNLDELSGQGIIYCDDEATCKSLSKSLRKNKIMAEAYINVSSPEKKEHINYLTNSFTSGGLPVLVTTHEAGKNLSNPRIRFIIHYDIPEDQELYQLHITQIGQLATDAVVHDLLVV